MLATTKPLGLIPTVIAFPGGIKSYLENPAAILDQPLPSCPRCRGNQGRWAVHGWCSRYTSCDGAWARTVVCRLRCPVCRATTRLLPDEIAPWLQYGLPSIATACEVYIETSASYRKTVLAVVSPSGPVRDGLSTCFNGPDSSGLSPSTVFRWLDRFSRGADAWWIILAAEGQQRSAGALRPPEPEADLTAKARSDSKAAALKTAWYLLWLLRWLLRFFDLTSARWPGLLTHAAIKPHRIDHTAWLARARPADARVPP